MTLSGHKRGSSPRRLLIVSHVVHYQYEGKLYAYSPYAKEIELWADLFHELLIASPLHQDTPPADCIPFEHKNIRVLPQPEFGGPAFKDKLIQVMALPLMVHSLAKAMRQADAIHVRCPGNLGLLGVLLAPFYTRYRIAKYAGQWNDYPGEALTTRLQKALLKSKWWNAPVTVYGQWPHQPKNVVPFFTSIMSDQQMTSAQKMASEKTLHDPLRVVYIGRLTKAKNVHTLLQAIGLFLGSGRRCECRIIGTGPEYDSLKKLTEELRIAGSVQFVGGLPFEEVLAQYQWADVLVLASETEGWPKAITEAMAFGVVCIGSNRGLIPQILTDERGFLVKPGDTQELADALIQISDSKEGYITKSRNASHWSKPYTNSRLQESLKELMSRSWNLNWESNQSTDKAAEKG